MLEPEDIQESCSLVSNQGSLMVFGFGPERSLQINFPSHHDHPSGRAQVSSRSDSQKTKTWIADIAGGGSDLVAHESIISDLVGHKRFVIRFRSASGATIVDQYLSEGLSIRSLKSDCSALFAKK
jgi:hypothetical protein